MEPLIASAGSGGSYTPPEEGVHQGVCVEIRDLGMIENSFKPGTLQKKIVIVWQLDSRKEDGTRYTVGKRYTLSLHEKATLRKDLEAWRGRKFTAQEERGFDVRTVVGANALLSVQHHDNAGKTYANVIAVMPLLKNMPKLVAESIQERQDRQPEPERLHSHAPAQLRPWTEPPDEYRRTESPTGADDDPLPF